MTELDSCWRSRRTMREALSADEKAKLDWLTQLKLIGQLNTTNTSFPRAVTFASRAPAGGCGCADERLAVLRDRYTKAQAGAEPKGAVTFELVGHSQPVATRWLVWWERCGSLC